jgi:uncharacterized RDD family membrane protein YckC
MPNTNDSSEVKYASFFMRIIASVIDSILSLVITIPFMMIIGTIFDLSQPESLDIQAQQMTQEELLIILQGHLASFLLEMTVIAVVIVIFWVSKGGTPGKTLLGMQIVDAKTLQKPTLSQSIIRYLGYFLSVIPCLLGFIWIYYDKRGQGFHDKLAKTVVIMVKKQNISKHQ